MEPLADMTVGYSEATHVNIVEKTRIVSRKEKYANFLDRVSLKLIHYPLCACACCMISYDSIICIKT